MTVSLFLITVVVVVLIDAPFVAWLMLIKKENDRHHRYHPLAAHQSIDCFFNLHALGACCTLGSFRTIAAFPWLTLHGDRYGAFYGYHVSEAMNKRATRPLHQLRLRFSR